MDRSPEPPRHPRFQILGVLGRGASGVVYRAFDREQGCQVALKTFHGSGLSVDSEEVRYLKQEFRSLAPLAHPNLVQLYELFVADDHCFFSMELVEGTGLLTRAWYGRSHPARVDYAFLRHAVQQLVAALSVLHGRGKLHRDIKPSNLLVDDMDRLVVLDFGVVADMRRLQSAEFAGTPAYMSPEQRSMAALTPAADWYSVGVVLFEALTGDLPALDSNPEAPRRIAPWTPEDLDALAVRLRAPHPGDRPSARAVAAWIAPASPAPRVIDADLPLVGRDRELSELMQALAESRQGPVVVQVEGVSGIGKSRLIECFAQRARAEQRAVVLSSCCLPEESIRFKAIDSIIDGLSELWLQPDAPRLDREALRDGWTAVRMFPVLGALLDSGSGGGTQDALDPQEVRRQAFLALQRLLFSVAAHSPLVLWIDDAQWGDLDSAALLREVLSGPSAPHCLVVFSHRSEDRDRSPFLARVAELEPRRTLEVGRLEAPTMRALIERIIGSRDAGLCDEIAVAANGSPFLIEEMCYAFRDGAVDRDAALATVQDLMAKRIRDLSPRERILVELAGISAGPLAQDVALEAAGATRSAHPRILALRNNRLLRLTSDATGTWLQPYHARTREAILGAMTSEDIVRCHRSLARVLEKHAAPPDLLAHHFAGAADWARAASCAAAAGDQAALALAFDQAARFYRQSREWHPGSTDAQLELLTREARALVNAGQGGGAADAYLAAAALTDGQRRRELRQLAAEQSLASGRIDEGVVLLRESLETARIRYPARSRALLPEIVLLLCAARLGGWLPTRIRGAASQERVSRVQVCAAAAKGFFPVDPYLSLWFAARALLTASLLGNPRLVDAVILAVVAGLLPLRGLGGWGERLLRGVLGRGIRQPRLHARARLAQAQIAMMACRWPAMREECEQSLRLLEQSQNVHWERNAAQMALIRGLCELGEFSRVDTVVEQLQISAEATGNRYAAATARIARADWLLTQGQVRSARRQVEAALAEWPNTEFDMQAFYAFRAELSSYLCEADLQHAADCLARIRDGNRRSRLYLHGRVSLDALLLETRIAIARAAKSGDLLDPSHRAARRCLSRLRRRATPDARAHALLLEGVLLQVQKQPALALEFLGRAERLFEDLCMQAHRLAATLLHAQLSRDPERVRGCRESLAVLGISSPAHWVAVNTGLAAENR